MAKHSQPVRPTKGTGSNGSIHVGTITSEQLTKMRKARERQERLASPVKQSGAGYHGGDEKTRKKRDRRQGRVEASDY